MAKHVILKSFWSILKSIIKLLRGNTVNCPGNITGTGALGEIQYTL